MIGQQLMFGQLGYPDGRIQNVDQWDGYPASRNRVFDVIEQNTLDNVVFLTGDIHSSWALELYRNPFAERSTPLAVELIAPSVTAYAYRVKTPEDARAQEADLLAALPHVAFTDQWHRGYLAVEVTREWRFVETFAERNPAAYTGARFRVASGTNRLERRP